MLWYVNKREMNILRYAILAKLNQKEYSKFYASSIIQQMYPEDWEQFQKELLSEVKMMHSEGLIQIENNKNLLSTDPQDVMISKP